MRNFLLSLATSRRWLVAVLLLAVAAPAWATNPQLQIVGTNPSGGDNTAFVDNIIVTRISTGLPVAGAVGDAGFETPNLGNGVFQYNPAGTPWTFTNQSGIAQNGSAFGAPTAPEGLQVGIVQITSSLTQNMALGSGTYVLTFQTAQRNCCSSSNNQSLNVYVAGVLVGTIQPPNDNMYHLFTSAQFTVDPPAVTSFTPTRNFLAAALASNVVVNFSQNIDNTTASTIKVFSAQAGGRKAGSYSTSGGTVTFNPTTDFKPGETVFTTIPAAVASTGGAATTNKQVYQFTTVAGGSGRGNFYGGSDPVVGSTPAQIVPADFNGDGNVDFVTTAVAFHNTGPNTAYVRLNNGSGIFSGGSDVAVGANPVGLAVGDVDGDGDLDIVTANENANTASIRLNNGSGTFGGTQEVSVGAGPYSVALGDVDGDGDLDLVTANYNQGNGSTTASVRLNGGDASGSNTGIFSGGSNPTVINNATGLALGDVDNDGDLDLLTYTFGNTVNVRLNNGGGTFAGGTTFTVAGNVNALVLGDVNGDSYLDAVTAGYNGNTASVRLNNGSGTFAGGSDLSFAGNVTMVALGDVDADGDLDLLATNGSSVNNVLVSVRLNNGSGTFAGGSDVAVGGFPYGLALADVDGDNDLDLLAANYSTSGTVNVRLNQVAAPTLTAVAPNPGGLGQAITLTGTNLNSPTALTINGANALGGILSNSGSSLVVRVPATAAASGTVSFTNAGGTVTLAFTVMPPPGNALALDGVNDYVRVPDNNTLDFGAGDFTVEAWVYKGASSSGYTNALGPGGKWNTGGSPGTNEWLLQTTVGGNDNLPSFLLESGTTIYAANGTVPVPLNRWTHLAGVRQGGSLLLYVNGVLQATTSIPATAAVNKVTGRDLLLGAIPSGYFANERLDELRIWNVARTAAQLQAGMTSSVAANAANLVAYYNFDQGTPGGTNTGLTTLYDLTANANHGTLTNFALTGTASNWVESYAQVVPVATAATARTATGFTANWTVPALGTVDNGYRLDVSTVSDFSAPIAGSPFTISSGTSQAVTGLSTNTTYYYRVRADKTSVTGQGDNSNTITVCPLPVAIAQNASVTLDVNGNATLAATAVNNGSTANCGPAAAPNLSVSPSNFSCTDAVPATVASALSFNGSTQYVEGTNSNLPLGNAARTLEAWVYPTAASANGIVFNYGTPTTNLRSGILLNNGNLYYVGENNDLRGNIALTVNAWNHVAATYDGTTLKLYVNGVLDVSSTPSAFNTTGTVWRIAQRSYPQTGEFLTGAVDEVRVWNVARTAAQIAANKNVGLPGGTAGLVAYYRLNEGSGSTTADATASASPGTLYGTPTWTTNAPAVTNGSLVTLTVTDAGGNTATAPAIVAVNVPATPTTTWNGSLSTSPLACQNWSYGQLPDATTNVVIPTGQPRYPTISTGTVATKDLTINAGGSLTVNSGTTLQVNGNLTNNGTATLAGTVALVGSAATQTLSSGTGFTTVTVNKPSGTVQLAQNLTINQALTLTSGTLTTTSSYQVNLGGSATLSESDASYVLGQVAVNRTLAPGTAESFGGLGLTLTPAAGSTAPGATLVTRTTGTALTGAGTSTSILRYFTITPATNTGLNVAMDFGYFLHELNGIPVANLALFKSVTTTSGPWARQSPITTGPNVVSKAGITDFSLWTLGNSANPLPVTLTSFTATASGAGASTIVRLAWATASEVNSQAFEVERSLDGVAFARIGTVAAAGTSPTAHTYALTDAQLPAGASLLYYRLRQVDVDGTSTYSPVRPVSLGTAPTAPQLLAYPNPAHEAVQVRLLGPTTSAPLELYDALGRLVRTQAAPVPDTEARLFLTSLPSGLYVLRCGLLTQRLTVE